MVNRIIQCLECWEILSYSQHDIDDCLADHNECKVSHCCDMGFKIARYSNRLVVNGREGLTSREEVWL